MKRNDKNNYSITAQPNAEAAMVLKKFEAELKNIIQKKSDLPGHLLGIMRTYYEFTLMDGMPALKPANYMQDGLNKSFMEDCLTKLVGKKGFQKEYFRWKNYPAEAFVLTPEGVELVLRLSDEQSQHSNSPRQIPHSNNNNINIPAPKSNSIVKPAFNTFLARSPQVSVFNNKNNNNFAAPVAEQNKVIKKEEKVANQSANMAPSSIIEPNALDQSNIKAMLEFYVDNLARFPGQIPELLRNTTTGVLLNEDALKIIINSALVGIPHAESDFALLATDLKNINEYASKSCKELNLEVKNYAQATIAEMVSKGAFELILEAQERIKQEAIKQAVADALAKQKVESEQEKVNVHFFR